MREAPWTGDPRATVGLSVSTPPEEDGPLSDSLQLVRRRTEPTAPPVISAVPVSALPPEQPGDTENLRPATDGLLAIAVAADRNGFELLRLTLQDASWSREPDDDPVASNIVLAIRAGDALAANHELAQDPSEPFITWVQLRDQTSRDVVNINSHGLVDLSPSASEIDVISRLVFTVAQASGEVPPT